MKRIWKEIKEAFPFWFYRKIQKKKVWKTTLDNRIPPNHINCRCISIPLDGLGKLIGIQRTFWMDMPDIEKWKFEFDPTYLDEKCHQALYYYRETDIGLRERIEMKKLDDYIQQEMFDIIKNAPKKIPHVI